MQLNSELSYGQAKSDQEGYKFNDSRISYYAGVNQTFNLGKNWNATWNSFYIRAEIRAIPLLNPLMIGLEGCEKTFLI